MKIMLDKSPVKIDEYRDKYGHEFLQLRTPLTSNSLHGCPYGLDNGCFTTFKRKTWERMLCEAREHKPIFVCLPDIVGSAQRTIELFKEFEHITNGLPRALVVQDGIGVQTINWSRVKAIFVGGSDQFKISSEAIAVAKTAKMLGKWVHVGRVNTPLRVQNWIGLADSIDGSGISRFDHMLESVLDSINGESKQIKMEAI